MRGHLILPALASLLAAIPAFAAQLGADWPDIQGRWSIIPRIRHDLAIDALEIASCPGGLCGRLVNADGTCGPTILRLTQARTGTAFGQIDALGLTMRSYAARQEERLLLGAHPPRTRPMTRTILPLTAEFRFDGPARCAPVTS